MKPKDIKNAEKSLLGALLISPAVYSRISTSFKPEFIFTPIAKTLYLGIIEQIKAKIQIDYTILAETTKLDFFEIARFLEECRVNCPTSENIVHYADIIKAYATKMKLEKISKYTLEQVKKDVTPLEIEKTLHMMLRSLHKWQNTIAGEQAENAFVQYTFDLCEEVDKARNEKHPVAYSIKDLDEELCRIPINTYVIVGAEQGAGKTIVGLNIALQNALNGRRVKFYCTDMTRTEIMQRIAAIVLGININAFLPHKITDALMGKLVEVEKRLAEIPLVFDFSTDTTIEDIEHDVLMSEYLNPYDLIVVDYIQNVKMKDEKIDRWQRIAAVTNRLRDIAKANTTRVLGLAQINRDGKKFKGAPEVYHLEGGASLEQTASQIILLWKDPEDAMCQEGKNIMMLIRKNRLGSPRVDIRVLCDYSKMTIYDSTSF